MRYFGSQIRKIEQIENALLNSNPKSQFFLNEGFCDPFCGSGIIAQHFSKKTKGLILAGDYANFAFYLTSYTTSLNGEKLNKYVELLNERVNDIKALNKSSTEFEHNFIKNYTVTIPYFNKLNGRRLVKYREYIEEMRLSGELNELDYNALLGALLESILRSANIRLLFDGAFKGGKPRPLLVLPNFPTRKGNKVNVFKQDYKETIEQLNGGVLYLNPPALKKDYVHYYHLLDTVISMRIGDIVDKSGRFLGFKNENKVSIWGKESSARNAFYELMLNNRAKYIVMTYNKNGVIPINDVRFGFLSNGNQRTFKEVDLGNEILFAIEGK